MTRIGTYSIPFLEDREKAAKYVLAEHREIVRVCSRLRDRLNKDRFDDIPAPFLEVDHRNRRIKFKELFWLDKGLYTFNRYMELRDAIDRMKNDGRIASKTPIVEMSAAWMVYENKREYWNDFEPEDWQIKIMELRVLERDGQNVSFEDYLDLIHQNKNIPLNTKKE